MVKSVLVLAAAAALVAADSSVTALPTPWGTQDVWVHTSTWYAGHCTCFCQPLCSHPSDFMRTNLVSGGLIPRFNNYSVPSCDTWGNYFAPAAIKAVGQTTLKNYFPVGFSRDLENMWSPNAPEGNQPTFAYPCGGLKDEGYLRTVVQLAKRLKTPKIITDNIGKEIKVADLRAAFKKDWGADVVLLCLDGAFADVLTCWSKGPALQGSGEIYPSKIQVCPPKIAAVDECINATTKILAYSIPTNAPVTDAPTDAPITTSIAPVTTTAVPTPTPTPAPTEIPSEVDIWVKFFQRNARCAVFGEENCSYCEAAKALLKSKKAKYDYFGVWMDNKEHIPSGMDVYYSLVRVTKQDTLPNIWIGGKFIGGSDDLHALNATGKLDQLLKDAKCT